MTNTAITTTARRIVRELNSRTRAGFTIYFDRDGRAVAEKYGPEGFGPADTNSYWVAFSTVADVAPSGLVRGVAKARLAPVQLVLDAMAAAEAAGLGSDFAYSLAQAWEDDDEAGRARETAEEHVRTLRAIERDMARNDY